MANLIVYVVTLKKSIEHNVPCVSCNSMLINKQELSAHIGFCNPSAIKCLQELTMLSEKYDNFSIDVFILAS